MRRFAALTAAALAAGIAAGGVPTHATAGTFNVLYSLCSLASCMDGQEPYSPLLVGPTGSLFGVLHAGGKNPGQGGALFSMVPDGSGYDYRLLHSFCGKPPNCWDGRAPFAGLIMDAAGNLYGTTESGGANSGGTVFELVLSGSERHFVVLHRFCADDSGTCPDGASPNLGALTFAGAAGGLPYDGVSPLYGTTSGGGANNFGTLYQLTPPAAGQTHWREKVLHSFCRKPACRDGSTPWQGLAMDGSGNLFGTTQYGGTYNKGLVFEFTQTTSGQWRESVLYNSCSEMGCVDGYEVSSPLVVDGSGSLLGTTDRGGNSGAGVLFRLTPGAGSASTYVVLHDFCSESGCADGGQPAGALVLGASGEIFGTTVRHGAHGDGDGAGVIYRVTGSSITAMHDFCAEAGCADGENPIGGLTLGPSGELFGTTHSGGAQGAGTVFAFVP